MTPPRAARRAAYDRAMAEPVRARLLATAGRLFYSEGIRAVGIDRVLAESGVAKSSMYAHFRTKEDLVVAYLDDHSAGFRGYLEERLAAEGTTGPAAVVTAFEALALGMSAPGFRGCAFVNATVEYPAHAGIRDAVARHRTWLTRRFAELLGDGYPDRERVAAMLLQLSTGASMTAYVDGDGTAGGCAVRAVATLLGVEGVNP